MNHFLHKPIKLATDSFSRLQVQIVITQSNDYQMTKMYTGLHADMFSYEYEISISWLC